MRTIGTSWPLGPAYCATDLGTLRRQVCSGGSKWPPAPIWCPPSSLSSAASKHGGDHPLIVAMGAFIVQTVLNPLPIQIVGAEFV